MQRNRTFPVLLLGLIVLSNGGLLASALDGSSLPESVAVLDLSELLPEESAPSTWTTVAFPSDRFISMSFCRAGVQGPQCSQYEIQWENGSSERIVETQSVWSWGERSSADGSRKLFEFSERRVPRFQHLLESLYSITTLGMSGPEDVNREVVRVVDTATRESCFESRRSFPMALCCRERFAAISPSGELVAITVGNSVSIFRLPAVCKGSTKMSTK